MRGLVYRAEDPLSFAGEPPCEGQRIVDFAVAFGEWFACFVGQDGGDVGFVLAYEGIPSE